MNPLLEELISLSFLTFSLLTEITGLAWSNSKIMQLLTIILLLSFICCFKSQSSQCASTDVGQLLQTFAGHTDVVYTVATLEDGDFISGSYDMTIIRWDPVTAAIKYRLYGHTNNIYDVIDLKNGYIASASADGTVMIWDRDTGELITAIAVVDQTLYAGYGVWSLFLLSNGTLCTGSDVNIIQLWNPMNGELLGTLSGFVNTVLSLVAFSDDSIIIGGSFAEAVVFNLHSGEIIATLTNQTSWVRTVILIQNETILACGSDDKTIVLYNTTTWEAIRKMVTTDRVYTLLSLSDGTICSGGHSFKLTIWDPFTGNTVRVFTAHAGSIIALAIRQDGSFVSASFDKLLKLWSPNAGYLLRELNGHTDEVVTILTLDSNVPHSFASCSWDFTIKLWDYESGNVIRTLYGHKDFIFGMALMDDGSLCTAGSDMTVKHWNPSTGELLRSIPIVFDGGMIVRCLVALNDGTLLGVGYSASFDDAIMLRWNITDNNSFEPVWTLIIPSETTGAMTIGIQYAIVLSNSTIATTHNNGAIGIWNDEDLLPQAKHELLQTFVGHTQAVSTVAILEDGDFFSGSYDMTIIRWDPVTAAIKFTLNGHTNYIYDVIDLRNGYIASASADGTVMIWDRDTGELITTIAVVDQTLYAGYGVWSLFLLSNGTLCTGSDVNIIQLWNPMNGELLGTLSGFVNTVLSLVAFSDDSIIIGGSFAEAVVFNLHSGEIIATLTNQTSWVRTVILIQNETILACGSDDKTIVLYNTTTWEVMNVLTSDGAVYTLLDLGDDTFASGGYWFDIEIWDIVSGELVDKFEAHTSDVLSLALTEDGSFISASYDNDLKLWSNDHNKDSGRYLYSNSTSFLRVLLEVPDYNYLISGSDDSNIYVWSLETSTIVQTLYGHTAEVYGLTVNPARDTLVSSSGDGTIRFWSFETWETIRVLTAQGIITTPVFLPLGNLITGTGSGSIQMWIITCDDGGAFCMPGSNLPILCSFPGYYCPSTHLAQIDKPVNCPQGYYCPGFSTVPTPCAPGTFSDASNVESNCLPCELHYYCGIASTLALLCPEGFYCIDSSQIEACPNGYFCPKGTVSLTNQLCLEGSYCNGTSVIVACPQGFFCPQGANSPLPCQSSYYCNSGSSAPEKCPLGFYCPDSSTKVACVGGLFCDVGSVSPTNCSSGYFCKDGKSILQCGSGFYCPTPAEQYPCDKGFYCPTGSTYQTKCDAGYYCDGVSSTKCDTGDYCDVGSKETSKCPASFYCPTPHNLYPCSKVGTYCPKGSIEEGVCEAGFFCQNSTVIQPCEKGYTCVKGSGSQTPCPIGTYNGEVESVDTAKCITCPLTYTTLKIASTSRQDCVCDLGYYAVVTNNNSTTCLLCIEGLECNSVGLNAQTVQIAMGFFPIKSDNEVNVLPCPPAACLNNATLTNNNSTYCSNGYKGFMCSSCISGFYLSSNICSDCSSTTLWNAGQVFLLFIATLIVIGYLIRGKVLTSDTIIRRGHNNTPMQSADAVNLSVVQRLVLTHLQVIGLLDKLHLTWPPIVKTLFETSGSVSSASFVSGDFSFGGGIKCLLYLHSLPETVNESLLTYITVILGIVLITLFWYVRKLQKRCRRQIIVVNATETGNRLGTNQKIVISIVAIIYITYSSIVRVFFQLFRCVTYPYDNKLRLAGDLDIICFSNDHLKWLSSVALPLFITLILGAPLICFIKLWRDNKMGRLQNDIAIMASYGFLFDGYRAEYWYWEIVTLGRKIALNAVCVFIQSPQDQAVCALGVLTTALIAQMLYKPFRDERLNHLEAVGLIVAVASLYFVNVSTILSSEGIITIIIMALNVSWYLYLFKLVAFRPYQLAARAFTNNLSSTSSRNLVATTQMTTNITNRLDSSSRST